MFFEVRLDPPSPLRAVAELAATRTDASGKARLEKPSEVSPVAPAAHRDNPLPCFSKHILAPAKIRLDRITRRARPRAEVSEKRCKKRCRCPGARLWPPCARKRPAWLLSRLPRRQQTLRRGGAAAQLHDSAHAGPARHGCQPRTPLPAQDLQQACCPHRN